MFSAKIQSNVFNIDNNNKKNIELQISILEWFHSGSCDTEDWSNDAENSALPSQE